MHFSVLSCGSWQEASALCHIGYSIALLIAQYLPSPGASEIRQKLHYLFVPGLQTHALSIVLYSLHSMCVIKSDPYSGGGELGSPKRSSSKEFVDRFLKSAHSPPALLWL